MIDPVFLLIIIYRRRRAFKPFAQAVSKTAQAVYCKKKRTAFEKAVLFLQRSLFEGFGEGGAAAAAADLEGAGPARHPDIRLAFRASEEAVFFAIAQAHEEFADLLFQILLDLIVAGVFAVPLHGVAGEKAKEEKQAEKQGNEPENDAVEPEAVHQSEDQPYR
jgi:hypothetical protein